MVTAGQSRIYNKQQVSWVLYLQNENQINTVIESQQWQEKTKQLYKILETGKKYRC